MTNLSKPVTDDAILTFIDEQDTAVTQPPVSGAADKRIQLPPWRVLVVDDDPDVHETTAFALDELEIAGRSVALLHAYSAEEGLETLRVTANVAVVLLDVVMETDDAGLRLVQRIRGELGLHNLRIILRTGQPGQAPELETIRAFDINDYKTKSELTRTKLFATLTTALRSYDQLRRLEASRRGLEQIVAASNHFIAEQGMQAFAEGVITQIAGALGIEPGGVVCASVEPNRHDRRTWGYVVIAAAGPYRHLMRCRIEDIEDAHIAQSLARCLTQKTTLLDSHSVTLYFAGNGGGSEGFAAHIAARLPLQEIDRHLLEVFCTNIALCASNVSLVHRLRGLAFVDRMLGLPNRTAFITHVDELLKGKGLSGMVLAELDVDQFGETNEMLGHRYGDMLLGALAQRLTQQLGQHAYVARLGGNTFGVLGLAAHVNAEALRTVFERPFHVDTVTRRLSASVGLVKCDEVSHTSAVGLIEDVFIALKRAKSQGHGRIEVFTPALGADARDRARLLHGLHRAFDHDRLFVVYQPKVDLRTGQTVGVEALMRWRAEDGSLVPPDRFIPVAEQSGLIVSLGSWVLRTALSSLLTLQQAGYTRIQMGVNVSAVQMSQPEFLGDLDEALKSKGVAPSDLELEITESVALIGMERATSLLDAIRARHIGIAIDDFGTGFSSLSYLDQLPANRIKIDRSFIEHLDNNRRGARIARMIVPLGHQLGLKVVAEGVETEAQLETLRELGCDEAQGFLFARPMVLDDLLRWLDGRPHEDKRAQGVS